MFWKGVVPALILALAAGCAGSEPAAPSTTDDAVIRVTAFTANTTISTLVVEVSAADINPPLVFNLVVDEATNVATGTLKVRPGTARTFSVTAFDDLGEITHDGQATADVKPGQNPPLQIKLGPRSGQVPITISFGSFAVLVSPAENELQLPGNAVVQLSVQVTDGDNQPVGDLTGLMWATTNPAIATVDASGLVTGHVAGVASIVATFEGVAGIALVNVSSAPVDFDLDGFLSDVDCNDGDAAIYPGAPEVLNGIDDDCDGQIDEGFLVDFDLDGFSPPLDCDDANATVYPGAPEVLNGMDDDCDGQIDEGLLVDLDLDGFSPPLDCDDANATVYPGAVELADGLDNDCDTLVDEGVALNETGFAAEADFCVLQFAPAVVNAGAPFSIFGRIFEAGLTEPAGGSPSILMEAGIAAAGAPDPVTSNSGWAFFATGFNVQVGDDDEYLASMTAPATPGNYLLVVRFRINDGWTYCDTDGAGSNAGLDWNFAFAAPLTVNP